MCLPGVIRHQQDDPSGQCEQEEGLHHGGGHDDVISVRLSQQESVSGEQQQSGRAAQAPAGRGVGTAESLMDIDAVSQHRGQRKLVLTVNCRRFYVYIYISTLWS